MMKNRLSLTSPDGSRNPPERSSCPLYSRDPKQERHKNPPKDQDENLSTVKVKVEVKEKPENSYVRAYQLCKKEEIPSKISTDPGDTRDPQRDDKAEEKEEGRVRIKEEEVEEPYVRNDDTSVMIDDTCVEEETPPEITKTVKRKTKEHSKELRDKIIELHTAGRGYKTISKCLLIPAHTIRSIIRKWKVHQTTETLPRKGRPSKLSEQTRRRLIKEATERPSVTLEELQSSVVKTGVMVHKTTISRALNKTGLLLSVQKERLHVHNGGHG